MFHTDHAGMTTADVDQVESVAGYFRFRRRCPKAEVQIGNGRVRSLLDSGSELNLIRELLNEDRISIVLFELSDTYR